MRLHRGVWAGACLLLALVGCSTGGSDEVKGHGVYSPVITGIASNNEPVARGVPNQLTVQVTNVNNLPLTYHWSVASGTVTDTTNVTATWTPLDSVAVYNVTVSIEAHDGEAYFFKTMTVAMSVDNQFIRWTKSEQIQQDPAPVPGGGVLFTEIHNTSTGSSDAYRVDLPQGLPIQLTTGFFSVGSPTPRSDRVEFGFAGKISSNTAVPTIYLLPFNGGDAANAIAIAAPNQNQTILRTPRFAPTGTRIAYVSDTTVIPYPKIWWRDANNLLTSPTSTVSTYSSETITSPLFFNVYLSPSWGRDITGEGNPDSILAVAADPFGNVTGLTKVSLPDTGNVWVDNPWLFSNQIQTPDWSPDGQYVAFAQKNAGTNERDIWIINAYSSDLSTAVRVTSGPADDSQPRFSEDSKRIFFVSNRVDHYGANGIQGIERRGRNIWSVAEFDKP
jgi:Tol biopolymer transport system component